MPKSLLLADDSITIQKVVQITFASEDFTITSVDNGDAALEKIKANKPNIVLADVVMPGKNGYELCQTIKNDPALKDTPVILLAGTFEPFDPERAKAVGADDFIVKPFETQALIDKVKKLVGMEITSVLSVSATPIAQKAASPAFAPPSNPLFAARPASPPPAPAVTPLAAPLGQPQAPRPIAPPPPSTASPFQGSGPLPAFGQQKPAAPTPAPVPAKDPFGMGPMFQQTPPKPAAPPPPAPDNSLPDIDMGDVEPMEVQKPAAPPPSPIAQAIAPKVVAATTSAIASNNVELNAAVRETIERIVWEIVPELAEAIIREELERLLREKA